MRALIALAALTLLFGVDWTEHIGVTGHSLVVLAVIVVVVWCYPTTADVERRATRSREQSPPRRSPHRP